MGMMLRKELGTLLEHSGLRRRALAEEQGKEDDLKPGENTHCDSPQVGGEQDKAILKSTWPCIAKTGFRDTENIETQECRE